MIPSDPSSRASAGERVDRELVDPGHRGDRAAHALAGDDEERVDEVVGRERRLADEVAQRGRAPQPARAVRAGVSRSASSGSCREVGHSAFSPKCDDESLNDALGSRLVGDEADRQPYLARGLGRLRADRDEERLLERLRDAGNLAASAARLRAPDPLASDDRVDARARAPPPRPREGSTRDRPVGDDRVDGRAPRAELRPRATARRCRPAGAGPRRPRARRARPRCPRRRRRSGTKAGSTPSVAHRRGGRRPDGGDLRSARASRRGAPAPRRRRSRS